MPRRQRYVARRCPAHRQEQERSHRTRSAQVGRFLALRRYASAATVCRTPMPCPSAGARALTQDAKRTGRAFFSFAALCLGGNGMSPADAPVHRQEQERSHRTRSAQIGRFLALRRYASAATVCRPPMPCPSAGARALTQGAKRTDRAFLALRRYASAAAVCRTPMPCPSAGARALTQGAKRTDRAFFSVAALCLGGSGMTPTDALPIGRSKSAHTGREAHRSGVF